MREESIGSAKGTARSPRGRSDCGWRTAAQGSAGFSGETKQGTAVALAGRMALRAMLLEVALLALAGCGGNVASNPTAPSDGGVSPDGSEASVPVPDGGEAGMPVGCGGCNCGSPTVTMGNATPDEACQITHATLGTGYSLSCQDFCAALNDGGAGAYFCMVPGAYVSAYQAAQPDGGDGGFDAGADAGIDCPAWSGDVVIQCGYQCTGRRTAGLDVDASGQDRALGAVFAERAYLEAVSVHAFARLERELGHHGAPESLSVEARRARRDEVRHAAIMARLACRHGREARLPPRQARSEVRSLFAVALENAVEGCVRETYGAVVGLVEARASRDPEVRRSLSRIAEDECRHAELAWAIASWALPQLSLEERRQIRAAMARGRPTSRAGRQRADRAAARGARLPDSRRRGVRARGT